MRRALSVGAVVDVAVVATVLALASPGTAVPPPPVTNYQVVTATAVVVNQKNVSLTASCPSGKRVLGGGGSQSVSTDPQNPYLFTLENSGPVSAETGWRADWDAGSQMSASFAVTALCANTT